MKTKHDMAAKLLKTTRGELGLTQADVAELFGVSIQMIKNYETRTRMPAEQLLKLCRLRNKHDLPCCLHCFVET